MAQRFNDMGMKTSLFSVSLMGLVLVGLTFAYETRTLSKHDSSAIEPPASHRFFKTADACMSCHNGLVTPAGEDISFGVDWRTSMMANSARDPYWQAAVRREVTDHPEEREAIENECSRCHMPMATFQANQSGEKGSVFEHLPIGTADSELGVLAADGVSCTMCHQIGKENLGSPESFTGGFELDPETPEELRSLFGPYAVDRGRSVVMHSATGYRQEASTHIQQSEVCATCHTLYTNVLGPAGEIVGELPEQVPYLEWRHSAYREEKSCQSCHMPVVADSTAISSVLGQPRADVSRHVFRGGNFFMQRMLNRYRSDLDVQALPHEMDAAIQRTEAHLQTNTARLAIKNVSMEEGVLEATVAVENLAGHKLPTAYPSRRAWIQFRVRDRNGRLIFESGALQKSGLISGNDNDQDPEKYEPHYTRISTGDQVQVYESVMVDVEDNLTTGLLSGFRYIKDNRLLPTGFDKATAREDFAVRGNAVEDDDFHGGGDQVLYAIDTSRFEGPFRIEAALWYQPIGYRWAENLKAYESEETDRFNEFYDAMSERSGIVLAKNSASIN